MINHLQSCFHSHSLLPTHQPTQQHILFSFQKHSHSLIPICLYSLLLEDSFPTNTQEYLLNSLVALIIHIPFEKYSIHHNRTTFITLLINTPFHTHISSSSISISSLLIWIPTSFRENHFGTQDSQSAGSLILHSLSHLIIYNWFINKQLNLPLHYSTQSLRTILFIISPPDILHPWIEDEQTHECVYLPPYGHEPHDRGQHTTHSTAAWCTA